MKPKGGRWFTVEFLLYYAYAAYFFWLVISRAFLLSADFDYGQWRVALQLKKGWISNRRMDLTDSQWRSFRNSLPILMAVMSAFTLVGAIVRKLCSPAVLTFYWLTVSLAYVLHLHGLCVLYILSLAVANYILVKLVAGSRALPALLWGFNCAMLVCIRLNDGFPFAYFGRDWRYLDAYRGMMRWHISYNMVLLRMISFGLDYHWARTCHPPVGNLESHRKTCEVCRSSPDGCYRLRQETALPLGSYSFVNYLCYLLYAPLFIAGPTISFNAFASQMKVPQQSYSRTAVVTYALRWATCLLLMEVMCHFLYFNGMAKSSVWQLLQPLDTCIIGYGVLNFMWLKFLLIWRFFRFWALVDGVEAPDNMLRCINNNYDIEGFWKSWHASYNRWLVRYLYIPLGGARWRAVSIWLIFTFVALWHDLEWKLLSWAWLTCLLGLPELAVKAFMRTDKMSWLRSSPWYRDCWAVAGALSITGLMCANLVGFVVGVSGMKVFAQQLLTWQSTPLLLGIFLSFYIGTKIMIEIREGEERERIAKEARFVEGQHQE